MPKELLLVSWWIYLVINILEAAFITSIWNVLEYVSVVEREKDIQKYIASNYSPFRQIIPTTGLLCLKNIYFKIFFLLTLPIGLILCHFLSEGTGTIMGKISWILPLFMLYLFVTVSIDLKKFYSSGTSQ